MAKKVRVSRKQVDAAKAEVTAFTVAGLRPDPLVVRIAEARSVRSAGTPAAGAKRTTP
jgi:hypothetical protein